jgi:carboxymethylenebutenolidase
MQIATQMIEFASNTGVTPGYLAQPEGEGQYPGLIAIQEWWGLVPHIKDVAERFAKQGFITLAPDLYHGQSAAEPDEARKLAMELDRQHAVQEIVAAISYLQGLPRVSPKKVGVVGWCMGGSLTIATAAASSQVSAAVAFYGMPADLKVVADIRGPLLGLYGENDHGISPERVHQFQAALEQANVVHEIHIYPGSGHAFFNDTRPHIYNPDAAQDAWERTLEWLRRYLR